jgi:hypothetical protein
MFSWASPELREIESNILLNAEMLLRHMLTMHLVFEGAIDTRIATRIWRIMPLLNDMSQEVRATKRFKIGSVYCSSVLITIFCRLKSE